ncbi:hypothetical protein [Macrococcoides caseolyticum]|uniref:hypothetical protein n=1 Tax=Macrococcoides caseolyticum TaxID=69966 RepID=UPI000C32C922|nr:hypothetical protein [Macrococcus caseolyticus]PKE17028.1 hypothetical protein CW718_06085 [Macrococcus caseolyticus]
MKKLYIILFPLSIAIMLLLFTPIGKNESVAYALITIGTILMITSLYTIVSEKEYKSKEISNQFSKLITTITENREQFLLSINAIEKEHSKKLIEEIRVSNEKLLDSISEGNDKILEGLSETNEKLLDGLLDDNGKLNEKLLGSISEGNDKILEGLSETNEKLLDGLLDDNGKLNEKLLDSISEGNDKILEGLSETNEKLLDGLLDDNGKLNEKLLDSISEGNDKILEELSNNTETLTKAIQESSNEISEKQLNISERLSEMISDQSEVYRKIHNSYEGNIHQLIELISNTKKFNETISVDNLNQQNQNQELLNEIKRLQEVLVQSTSELADSKSEERKQLLKIQKQMIDKYSV